MPALRLPQTVQQGICMLNFFQVLARQHFGAVSRCFFRHSGFSSDLNFLVFGPLSKPDSPTNRDNNSHLYQ
jgi:hypothetical protein